MAIVISIPLIYVGIVFWTAIAMEKGPIIGIITLGAIFIAVGSLLLSVSMDPAKREIE